MGYLPLKVGLSAGHWCQHLVMQLSMNFTIASGPVIAFISGLCPPITAIDICSSPIATVTQAASYFDQSVRISAVFAVERCLYVSSSDVCLSVCPSVTIRYCVKTAQPIVEKLSQPDAISILVFSER